MAKSTVQQSQIRSICATTKTNLAPDISYEYTKDTEGRTVRRAQGVEMDRSDVLTKDGWADYSWYDARSKKTWVLKDEKGNIRTAAVGVSQWHGKGPTIAASRNCLGCHRTRGAASVGVDLSLLAKAGPVEAGLITGGHLGATASARPTRQPAETHVCETPRKPPRDPQVVIKPTQGPPGPAGPRGPQGPAGNTPVIDYERIVTAVLAAIPKQTGPTEAQIIAIVERVIAQHRPEIAQEIKVLIANEVIRNIEAFELDKLAIDIAALKRHSHDTPEIDYDAIIARLPKPVIDYDEIASHVKIPPAEINYTEIAEEIKKRLKPLHIGAKQLDASGNLRISMEAVPVELGDTVYVHIEPPRFDYDAIAVEVKKKLNQPPE